ncbi:MAG: hypothetical protein H0X40_19085 [Chthoniobacterales bacterium]|nr:hypothetical protein [Chthoniobacterales bacterium]
MTYETDAKRSFLFLHRRHAHLFHFRIIRHPLHRAFMDSGFFIIWSHIIFVIAGPKW